MNEHVNALTARWAGRLGGSSTVLSGAGAWPLLAFLLAGASGPAREELAAAAGVAPGGAAEAGREVLDAMAAVPAVRAALGLWTREGLDVEPSWAAGLPPGSRERLAGDGGDQARLDAWAARHTGGLIDRMPVRVLPTTLLVLATALSLKTEWEQRFTDGVADGAGPWAGTRLAALSRVSAALGDVTVAGGVTSLRVRGREGVDVRLLLGAPGAPAAAVLAAGLGGGPAGAPEDGPGVSVRTVTATAPGDRLSVTVPRFTVSGEHDLLALPDVFGLRAASEETGAFFPGISRTPLHVQQARQNAMAVFSAEGFEAAAVTAVAMARSVAFAPSHEVRQVSVTIDRPFGFVAEDRATGLVLVAGWVAEPEPWKSPW